MRKFSEEHRKNLSKAMKGKVRSKEHRKNLSESHKGKKRQPHTEETRKKISEALKGKRKDWQRGSGHHNWKGGITPLNKLIRHSVEYKLWHDAVFERDDFTCRFCGIRGGDLEADHIKPFAVYPELRFAIDNGRTLCKPCHRTTETFGRNT